MQQFTPEELAEIARQQAGQGQTLAGPVPMAPPQMPVGRPMSNPYRNQAQQLDAGRYGLAQQGQANENARVGFAADANAREARERQVKEATLAANGGVDTMATQDQAAGHAVMLTTALNAIRGAKATDPSATKPGWIETIAHGSGNETAISATQSEQRQVVYTATQGAVESAIWLMTGAAAPEDQVKRLMLGVAPLVTDKPSVLAFKEKQLRAYIAQAKARAGPANVKVQQALAELEEMTPTMYGSEEIKPPEAQRSEIGSDVKQRPVPEGYQTAHKDFLTQHPPGKLTVADYMRMRQTLDSAFAQELGGVATDLKTAEEYVRAYNEGKAPVEIPAIQAPISGVEKIISDNLDSGSGAALINAANAGSFGLVEGLSGQEGRDAFHALNEEHSAGALAGDVLGSITPISAVEQLGARGLKQFAPHLFDNPLTRKKILGQAAAMGTYSAARGFNSAEEGEGLEGAAKGAAVGVATPFVSNLVVKGAKPFLSAPTQKALEQLKGVKLSTLQRLGLGHIEEAARGLPFVNRERNRVLDSFNVDNANRVLARVGLQLPKGTKPGSDANAKVHELLNGKFEEIKPLIVGKDDGNFVNVITAMGAKVKKSPERAAMFDEIKDALSLFRNDAGHYTGQSYRDTVDRLRLLTDSWSGKTASGGKVTVAEKDMAHMAGNVVKEIRNLVGRNTPDVLARLRPLETAWKHKIHIEGATNKALKQGGIYSPGNLVDETKGLDASTRKGAMARGEGFDQDYAAAGVKVIGASPAGNLSPQEIAMVTGLGVGASQAKMRFIPLFLKTAAVGLYGPGIKQVVRVALTGKRPLSEEHQDILRQAFQAYLAKEGVEPGAPDPTAPVLRGN